MKTTGGLASRLLVSASSVFEELAPERKPLFSPPLGLMLAVTAAAAVSFAKGVIACAAALAGGAVLASWGKGFKAWISVVLASLLFSLAVTVPLLAVAAEPLGAAGAALLAVLRAVSAAAVFTGFAVCLGWRGVVEGLGGLGMPELAFSLGLLLKYIPIFLRDLAGILAAREARAVRKGLRLSWTLLASAAGEVLVRGYARAEALRMALEARSFTGSAFKVERRARLSKVEVALLAYTLSIAAAAWWSI